MRGQGALEKSLLLGDKWRIWVKEGGMPGKVEISPVQNTAENRVDLDAARQGCINVMMRPGFSAPKLLEQARLQAWTLKPAILAAG